MRIGEHEPPCRQSPPAAFPRRITFQDRRGKVAVSRPFARRASPPACGSTSVGRAAVFRAVEIGMFQHQVLHHAYTRPRPADPLPAATARPGPGSRRRSPVSRVPHPAPPPRRAAAPPRTGRWHRSVSGSGDPAPCPARSAPRAGRGSRSSAATARPRHGADRRDRVDQLGQAGDLDPVGVAQQRDQHQPDHQRVLMRVGGLEQRRPDLPRAARPSAADRRVLVPDIPLVKGQVERLLQPFPGLDVVADRDDRMDKGVHLHASGPGKCRGRRLTLL